MNEITTQQTHTETPATKSTPVYNGWLVSNDLIKRSVAVFLHSLLGQLIIVVPLMIIMFILAFSVAGVHI